MRRETIDGLMDALVKAAQSGTPGEISDARSDLGRFMMNHSQDAPSGPGNTPVSHDRPKNVLDYAEALQRFYETFPRLVGVGKLLGLIILRLAIQDARITVPSLGQENQWNGEWADELIRQHQQVFPELHTHPPMNSPAEGDTE